MTEQTTFVYLTVVNSFRMIGIAMVFMPVITAGINQLPTHLIPHGTAMNNTMRQMAGAVGVALLVTIMTNHALPGQGVAGFIHGVNVSFAAAAAAAAVGLVLAFFIEGNL